MGVYAHRWHLPYTEMLFLLRLQMFIMLESIRILIKMFLRLNSKDLI